MLRSLLLSPYLKIKSIPKIHLRNEKFKLDSMISVIENAYTSVSVLLIVLLKSEYIK